jgi:UV excision repair protein RAD23
MQITVKSIDKTVRTVEGDFQTVLDVSQKLAADHGFDVACQVLIFQGKMLKPVDPVIPAMSDNFMVLTMKKPKAAPKQQIEPASPVAEPTDAAIPHNPAIVVSQNPEEEAAEEGEPSATQAQVEVPEAPQEMVDALKAMGFDLAQIKIALRLSRNDPNLAGALLMEPQMMLQAQQMEESGQGNPMQDGTASVAGQPGAGGQLTEQHVMEMMEQQPQMLQQIMAMLHQQDPNMAQQLQQNPQQLLTVVTQILNQMGPADDMQGADGMGMEGTEDGQDAGNQQPQGQIQVPMTLEETEAVEGLTAMFPHIPHSEVLQTFKACGSDAGLAANMLFDYNPAIM